MEKERKKRYYANIFLAGLVALLVLLIFLLSREYERLSRLPLFPEGGSFASELRARRVLSPASAGAVRSWMTFEYVNRLFALPPGYLKTALRIADARYPKMTVGSYAKRLGVSPAAFLSEVENAIRGFEAGTSTPSL